MSIYFERSVHREHVRELVVRGARAIVRDVLSEHDVRLDGGGPHMVFGPDDLPLLERLVAELRKVAGGADAPR